MGILSAKVLNKFRQYVGRNRGTGCKVQLARQTVFAIAHQGFERHGISHGFFGLLDDFDAHGCGYHVFVGALKNFHIQFGFQF